MSGALVDVDGTLIAPPSTEVRFALHLFRARRLGPRQAARAALFLARWGPRYGLRVFKKNKAYLDGLPVDAVAEIAEAFLRDEIAPRLRASVLRRLEAHRAAGEGIALVTGAPDFIARALAPHVGATAWAATECARRDGLFTDAPPLTHPFGAEKIVHARRLCARLGWSLDDCAAYGDSVHDAALLARVARPVAVHPDRTLARIAAERGWDVIAD